MIQVAFHVQTLRCISQADISDNAVLGGDTSEPYIWVAFFFFDPFAGKKTISMLPGLSCRDVLPENVRAGTVLQIPVLLGTSKMVLDDSTIVKPVAGLIVVVLEENETRDALIQIGHQEFGNAVDDEIRTVSGDLTDEQKQAMEDRVRDRVITAIRNNSGIFDSFRVQDRFIGSIVKSFDYPLLKLLLDKAPGLPYPIQDRLRSERTIRLPSPFPPIQAVDEYEINASIQVSPFVPPGPDPCQAQKDALAAANGEIERIEGDILDLQSQLRLAPAPKKQEIRNKIRALQAERRTAVQEMDRAIEALRQCQTKHPVLSGFSAAEF